MKEPKKLRKGFAVMSLEQRTAIARMGGVAVSRGRKGRQHMRENGARGGRVTGERYVKILRNPPKDNT